MKKKIMVAIGLTIIAVLLVPSAMPTIGTANAQNITDDPFGLLEGTSTFVEKNWNPGLDLDLVSAVTSIRFHTDTVAGTNSDGSPKYTASYAPGGLVDEPVGIVKEMNGVTYTEYSGELSGFGYSSLGGGQYIYGPIGAPDEPACWANTRAGLKGVPFVLRIPKKWNGELVHFMHGGIQSTIGHFITAPFDDFYLLSQGFAYITMNCAGYSQATDTNQNNDEYWRDTLYGDWQFNPPDSTYVTPNAVLTEVGVTWALVPEPMFSRDAIRVMKNICSLETGKSVKHTYLWARSWGGDLSIGLTTGRSWNGVYLGGNYVTPFSNCPVFPDGTANPDYSPNTAMVYDGFLNFQISDGVLLEPDHSYVTELDPTMPISFAPFVMYNGESFSGDMLLFPWLAHKAKNDTVNGDFSACWPDIKDTVFYYMFENLPHFGRENVYAVDKNGSGLYAEIDPETGLLTFNENGDGQEVRWEIERLYDIDESMLINSIYTLKSVPGLFLYFSSTSPTSYGLSHQLLNNLHSCVIKGKEMPESLLDPYWINGGTITPKFIGYTGYMQSDVTDSPQVDISNDEHYGGAYYDAIQYIVTNDVLNYNKTQAAPIRMPDDAARLGLYQSYFSGCFQFLYYQFNEAELINGFPALDWDNQPLVTMTLPNRRRIPGDGYRNHGGYVSAVTHAVNNLVNTGFWDKQLSQKFITDSSNSKLPLVISKNLGTAQKNLEGYSPFNSK
ncbi:MAG: hypothetical protein JW712_02825 [Dehalococcoidales bacterium]|nr:hypothetical protein [Dehalococcoidales bacterium]